MEYRLGESPAARLHLRQLLRASRTITRAGRCWLRSSCVTANPQRAAEIYSTLIRRSLQVDEQINLGTAYMLLARYPEAEATFRQVLRQPRNPPALLSLADTLLLQSRRAEAETLYRRISSA